MNESQNKLLCYILQIFSNATFQTWVEILGVIWGYISQIFEPFLLFSTHFVCDNFMSFQSSSHHLCNSKSQLQLFPNISQSCHILQHFALHLIIYFVSCFLFLQAELSQALTSLTEKARNAKDFMVQLKHTVEHVQVGISVIIISCSLFMFIENMFSMVQGYRCGWNFMSKFGCLWNEEQYSMLIWQIFWMVVLWFLLKMNINGTKWPKTKHHVLWYKWVAFMKVVS